MLPTGVNHRDSSSGAPHHFDSLDSEAGIALGCASAIVALSPRGHPLIVEVGRGAAGISGLLLLVLDTLTNEIPTGILTPLTL
jgi:hypothetical protein